MRDDLVFHYKLARPVTFTRNHTSLVRFRQVRSPLRSVPFTRRPRRFLRDRVSPPIWTSTCLRSRLSPGRPYPRSARCALLARVLSLSCRALFRPLSLICLSLSIVGLTLSRRALRLPHCLSLSIVGLSSSSLSACVG